MTSGRGIRRFDVRASPPDEEILGEVCRHLERGGLLTYPTETVYGFGCALREDALRHLSELKDRDPDKPFLVLVPDRRSVSDLRWTPEAGEMAEVFWPGALTLILEDSEHHYPGRIRSPSGGVAVRQSPHPVARAVVERLGAPLTSTSANLPGAEPARTADDAERVVRRLGVGEEMWLLDGGRLPPSDPSTIVDCTGAEPSVLRAGAVSVQRIRCLRVEES